MSNHTAEEPMTVAQAQRVAESMLADVPSRIEQFHPGVGGDDSYAFRLWVGAEAMLLKVKKRPGSPIGVYFHERVRQAGVPVPELIAFDARAGPDGQAGAIWRWIDGRPAGWGAGDPCPYDEAELGEILRRIHDLEFDGCFGFLGDDPCRERSFTCTPDMAPTSAAWGNLFMCDRAAKRYLFKGYIDEAEADIISSLPDRVVNELSRASHRLLHMGDIMHHGNLIVAPASGGAGRSTPKRQILAVVDYVESMVGDPRWELAWFDYYFTQCPFERPDFDMTRFRSAYGTDHDPDDRLGQFYLAAILLFEKLLHFDPRSARGRWAIETLRATLASFDSNADQGTGKQQD